jgi:hypothetical protein
MPIEMDTGLVSFEVCKVVPWKRKLGENNMSARTGQGQRTDDEMNRDLYEKGKDDKKGGSWIEPKNCLLHSTVILGSSLSKDHAKFLCIVGMKIAEL